MTLHGVNSREFFQASIDAKARTEQAGDDALTPQFAVEERAQYLAGVIKNWSHESLLGVFSKERVVELFGDIEMAVYADQIERHIMQRQHFFPK